MDETFLDIANAISYLMSVKLNSSFLLKLIYYLPFSGVPTRLSPKRRHRTRKAEYYFLRSLYRSFYTLFNVGPHRTRTGLCVTMSTQMFFFQFRYEHNTLASLYLYT